MFTEDIVLGVIFDNRFLRYKEGLTRRGLVILCLV